MKDTVYIPEEIIAAIRTGVMDIRSMIPDSKDKLQLNLEHFLSGGFNEMAIADAHGDWDTDSTSPKISEQNDDEL